MCQPRNVLGGEGRGRGGGARVNIFLGTMLYYLLSNAVGRKYCRNYIPENGADKTYRRAAKVESLEYVLENTLSVCNSF